ncbi:PsiF family protein [Methylocystis echinoides]|jgi:hypothetical protein|uniref:PsiF family protein n=1 Tax=Methylocystis echinoides TaxID=29468 RepID=UPI00342BF8F3
MYKSIKIILSAGAVVALSGASAFAETVWKPPEEVAPKAAAEAAPAPAAATSQASPQSPADKEKACAEQAKEKGLKGKAKKQFKAECVKS